MLMRKVKIVLTLLTVYSLSHFGHNFQHHSEDVSLVPEHSHSLGCYLTSLFVPRDFDHERGHEGIPGKSDCPTCKILAGTRYSTIATTIGASEPAPKPEIMKLFFEPSDRALDSIFSHSAVPRAPPV